MRREKFFRRAESQMLRWKQRLAEKENGGKPFDRGPTDYGPKELVLPAHLTMLNLYGPLRDGIRKYFCDGGIAYHGYVGHLVSSQAFCLNLFGVALYNKDFVLPILGALPHNSNAASITVSDLDFEWNDYDIVYHKFGETTGRRGDKQTSCDVAIRYTADGIPCVLLIEFKFTEGSKSSYDSLGRCFTSKDKEKLSKGCEERSAAWVKPFESCALEVSQRKPQHYWSVLRAAEGGPFDQAFLNCGGACPFQYEGYQLMRSQLMGWLYESRGKTMRHDFMLLFDGRNEALNEKISGMKPIRIGDERLSFLEWSNNVRGGRFHWRTIQDMWKLLCPDEEHRRYIEERYLNWE